MNDEAKVEIKFGLKNCQSLPQKRFFAKNLLPDKIVYTDASSFACAGFTVETYTRVVHKNYSAYITVTWYKRNYLAGDLC
jgi:hypothetical protein